MKRVHTYLSSPFLVIIFLRLSCFDKKKKKTTYNPINQNSFSDSIQTIQILLFCLKSLPKKIPTKSNSNQSKKKKETRKVKEGEKKGRS